MAEHYMEVDELGKVPMANSLRKQDGLKRKILELVRHMPAPDRECETTDFLHALQYVLDEYEKEKAGAFDLVEKKDEKVYGIGLVNYGYNPQEAIIISALDKIESYSEALATAINAIEDQGGVIQGCDSESVVKMIRHIAQHGIDDLREGDRKYIDYINSQK